MLEIGLIGCGVISGAHRHAWAKLGDRARLAATADPDLGRARAAADPSGARAVADYHELLADPAVAAVDLCLPHHLHRAVAIDCLRAGRHVLLEKPIATSLEDADAIIAAAEAAGRVLMVAENCRFDPTVPLARRLMDEGEIGQPILCQVLSAWFQGGEYLDTAWRFDPSTMGGGMLIDGGHHRVDTLLTLLGRPTRLSCLTRRVREVFPTEDTVAIVADFADGVLAQLALTQSTHWHPDQMFRVVGSEGSLTGRRDGVEVRGTGREATFHAAPPVDTFLAEMTHFLDCIETGSRPLMGGPEARATLEFVLAAYESARSGRVVELAST
jgi:predicted dehydrogenase